MGSQYIAFEKTGRFSDLICDYLREEKSLRPFYGHPPNLKGFEKQIKLKKNQDMVSKWVRIDLRGEKLEKD